MPKDWEGHESAGRRPKPHSLFGAAHRASLGSHWSDYLVHVYSFSKSYAIPGYRLGALVASPKLLEQALKISASLCLLRGAISTIRTGLTWPLLYSRHSNHLSSTRRSGSRRVGDPEHSKVARGHARRSERAA